VKPIFILILILSFVGCSGKPVTSEISPEEVIRRGQEFRQELARQFESHFKFNNNTEVLVYLRSLAQTISENVPELQKSSIGVWLIKEPDKKWYNYGLPEGRVYLSTNMVRRCNYENELTAAIALQFAHILTRHVIERLQKESPRDEELSSLGEVAVGGKIGLGPKIQFLGPKGILTFSEGAEIQAVQSAVLILYHSGYDARGLISLFELYQNNPLHSPYEMGTIKKLIEKTRREIALYAPLRNPIVRSQSFLMIQKRMKQL
jgi:predicted Zn-dependent protease